MLVGHSWANLGGTILQIDDPVADLLKRRRRDIEGLSYLAITCPADRRRNAAVVSTLRPGAGPQSIRKRYLAGDGSEVWVTLHTARIGANVASDHLVGTFIVDEEEGAPRRLWQQATQMLEFYRLRETVLGSQLFADRAWLILLHTYLAEAEGRAIGLPELASKSRSPEAMVGTWVKALSHSGLVVIHPGEKGTIELTQVGITKLESLLKSNQKIGG